MTAAPLTQMRCREIEKSDLDDVVALLHRGFPERSPARLARALDRLATHRTPPGFPKFGYVLDNGECLVGALLVIFSAIAAEGGSHVRGNVACWYVDPSYRSYASLLTARVLSRRDVTFLNVTPAPHTWPILEAQGFERRCSGLFAAVPALSGIDQEVRIRAFSGTAHENVGLSAYERDLMREHSRYGCITVVCESGGHQLPFVFGRRGWIRWKSIPVPTSILAYSRSVDEFARFAGSLGRYLVRRGIVLVFVDANAAIPGLRGKYLAWGPKFHRGPYPPHLGDLAYTERFVLDL